MNKLAIAAVAAAGVAFAGSAYASTNLITNGSFETGNISSWVYSGSGADVGAGGHPAVIIPYNSSSSYPGGAFGEPIPPDNALGNGSPDPVGNYAAYFVADNSHESLSQTVHLLPGVYTIGFDVYVPLNGFNNSGNATFQGSIAGVNLANFDAHHATPQTWMSFHGLAHITTEGDYLSSFVYNSGAAPAADFLVDRAYIVAGNVVPEPATWALMIMGFGGAGAALRRSRRLAATAA